MKKKEILFIVTMTAAMAGWTWAQDKNGQIPARFKFFFSERIRQETTDNVTSLNEGANDSSSYVRFKTSFGLAWRPASRLEITIKLTNENRFYLAPKTDPKLFKNFDFNETFFDQFYLSWKSPFQLPVNLTMGRQDIQFGEGFLIFDGGPLDGSRSAYFNGIRLDYNLKATDTLTFFYIFQPTTDTILPVIHDLKQKMVEQAEEGYGAYFKGGLGSNRIEFYLMRKNIQAENELPAAYIHTVGGRIQAPFGQSLSLTAEAAYQFGKLDTMSRRGFGGYFHLDYQIQAAVPFPSLLTLAGIYLSGDNPGTLDRYEGWDPAFSRWPKWSDSFIYFLARESKPALWSDLISIYGTAVFLPLEKVKLSLTLHRLWAVENSQPTAWLSGEGKNRGLLFIAKLLYEISRNLSGHFIWESFNPGSYYFYSAKSYTWVRFELQFQF